MSLSQNFYVSRKSTPTTEKTDFSGAPATSQRVLAISIGWDDNEIFFSHPDYQCMFSLCVCFSPAFGPFITPSFFPDCFIYTSAYYICAKESKRTIRRKRGIRGSDMHTKNVVECIVKQKYIHIYVGGI